MEQAGTRLAEGKTKIIWDAGDGDVLIESKNDIAAGDGAKHDVMQGKAEFATQTTVNCFRLLTAAGVPNHFVDQASETVFKAQRVAMFPLELVTRRLAFGSYLMRNPEVEQGTRFRNVEFETFAKEDASHDPFVQFDPDAELVKLYRPKEPVSPESLIRAEPYGDSQFYVPEATAYDMWQVSVKTFETLEAAWAEQEVTLVDLKIECGLTDDGRFVVADVIDNDSWRIWPGGDPNQMADKELYRNGQPLSYVADRYAWVAEATNRFLP